MTELNLQTAIEHHRQHGWALFRNIFPCQEVQEMAKAIEEVQQQVQLYPQGYAEGSLRIDANATVEGKPYSTCAQWSCYRHSVMNKYRNHPRLSQIILPLLGQDVKQVKSQIHWKPAQADGVGRIKWHQDCQFRKPSEFFRKLGTHATQALIAIDKSTVQHGALQIHTQSHACGDLRLEKSNIDQMNLIHVLQHAGLSDEGMQHICMEPGDVLTFTPYILHGSGLNYADGERRVFINGYLSAEACDIGVWAWRNSEACELPEVPHPMEWDQARQQCHPHVMGKPELRLDKMIPIA